MHFPTGLLSKAKEFFEEYDISYNILDKRTCPSDNMSLSYNEGMELRGYQEDVVTKSVQRGRGIIKAATGSGKTCISCGIINELSCAPSVFFVTSKDLLYQAKEEFERFLLQDNKKINIGVVGDGKCSISDINIVTVQTAIRSLTKKGSQKKKPLMTSEISIEDEKEVSNDDKSRIKELINNCKLMICDEVQHWSSETCQVVSDNCTDSYYRYGISATPFRDMGDDILIDGCFGKTISEISASFLIREGFLVKPKICFVHTSGVFKGNYHQVYSDAIVNNE